MVFEPLGAVGYVSMVVAISIFACWVGGALLGLHDPVTNRSPARLGLAALWLVIVLSYVTTPASSLDPAQRASADRWLLALCGMSGLILVIAQMVSTLARAAALLRALTVGAFICSVGAIYQFVMRTDPFDAVRWLMVGMVDNGGNTTFQVRGSFLRVAGSTFSPIELGVVLAMVLPFAVWRALFWTQRRKPFHWLQVCVIGLAAVMTVSRSAILSLAIVAIVFLPSLPPLARRWSMAIVPLSIALVFLVIPGFVSTITEAFGAGTSDPSLETRVDDWPRVEAQVQEYPLTGMGIGAYQPRTALEILDNQYLGIMVEMGLVGLAGFLVFLMLPLLSSIYVMVVSGSREVRCLAGAAASATAVAVVSSGTFDSLSFPVFLIVLSAVVGLSGASWALEAAARQRTGAASSDAREL